MAHPQKLEFAKPDSSCYHLFKSSCGEAAFRETTLPALLVLRADGAVPAGLDGAHGRLAFDDVAAGNGVAVEVHLDVVKLKR